MWKSRNDRRMGRGTRRGCRGENNRLRPAGKACLVENKEVRMKTGNTSPDRGLSYKEAGKEDHIPVSRLWKLPG